jgi:hypothetical protein
MTVKTEQQEGRQKGVWVYWHRAFPGPREQPAGKHHQRVVMVYFAGAVLKRMVQVSPCITRSALST